jgi:hypothetical protein
VSEKIISENTTTQRFVERGFVYHQITLVNVYGDSALLPEDFEFVGAVSQRHPEAQDRT